MADQPVRAADTHPSDPSIATPENPMSTKKSTRKPRIADTKPASTKVGELGADSLDKVTGGGGAPAPRRGPAGPGG
jgi:hypothetical protein